MKALLFYLLQVMAASGILYSYYHFFLRNKKFHQYNRFYLLAAILISVLVPFLDIPVYVSASEADTSIVWQTLTTISSSGENERIMENVGTSKTSVQHFTTTDLFYCLYALAAALLLLRTIISLLKIRKLSRSNRVEKLDKIHFVHTQEPGTPFSFFRWLFWNTNIELRSPKGQQIFRHELYHIHQKHSLDLLFMELLSILFWFNPFFHMMKKELRAIHEFLADKFAAEETTRGEYASLLLSQALNTRHTLVNPFFHNQIKRRITMIINPKKTSHQYLRKLLVLPVAAIVVSLFAFTYKNKALTLKLAPVPFAGKPITVVIDAGHGGIDPGSLSPDNKYSEAKLSLEMAKTIQSLANEYNINVVMTRENDELPGGATNKNDGIRKRIEMADKVNPDAFIAIHFNKAGKSQYQDEYAGVETYISAKKDDIKDRDLATLVLQQVSSVQKINMTIRKRKEAGIYVLDKANYPSVLVMCGYINNKADIDFITNAANREKLARSILRAIAKFKTGSAAPASNMNNQPPDKSIKEILLVDTL